LVAGDTGIAGILSDPETALQLAGLRSADLAGDAFDLWVVKAIDDDFIVGPEQAKPRTD